MAARQAADGQQRGVFEVDEEAARWLSWSWPGPMAATTASAPRAAPGRRSAAPETCSTGDTPDALTRKIRAHWQAMQ